MKTNVEQEAKKDIAALQQEKQALKFMICWEEGSL